MERKRRLQAEYFRNGYDGEKVRELTGGKLVLTEGGEVAGHDWEAQCWYSILSAG